MGAQFWTRNRRRLWRAEWRPGNSSCSNTTPPPPSPEITPEDIFLFPKLENYLAGKTLAQEIFDKEWEGVVPTVAEEAFTAAFR